jgi:hypothetical protein
MYLKNKKSRRGSALGRSTTSAYSATGLSRRDLPFI